MTPRCNRQLIFLQSRSHRIVSPQAAVFSLLAAAACSSDDASPTAKNLVSSPADSSLQVVDEDVMFRGKVICDAGAMQVIADDQFVLGNPPVDADGNWALAYSFTSAGNMRKISVIPPANCGASVDLKLTIQPTVSYTVQQKTDADGCRFKAHLITVPTASTKWQLFVDGRSTSATVETQGQAIGAFANINAGYFSQGQGPVSYAKGQLGYESPSGNVKGPRGCLAIDNDTKLPRIELSGGRVFSAGSFGASLFPNDREVACGGPLLVKSGDNVATAQIEVENFQTSGIGQNAALPRSALCIRADKSVLLIAAQSDSVRSCGFSLPQLATYLISLGCVDALNLDGGGSTAVWANGNPPRYSFGIEDRPVYQVIGAIAIQ